MTKGFEAILEKAKPLDQWPVAVVIIDPVGLQLGIPLSYRELSEGSDPVGGDFIELGGPTACDWLRVERLKSVQGDLVNWIQSGLALTGTLPGHTHRGEEVRPTLLSLAPHEEVESQASKLKAEALLGFEGVAEFQEGEERLLARIYVLLLRNKTMSWKVCLGIDSACAPGSDEETIYQNDHVRAQQVFGNLQILEGKQ